MSADRPNFDAIAARIREEVRERFRRGKLMRLAQVAIRYQAEISGRDRDDTDPIWVDDKGTALSAENYDQQLRVKITSSDPGTRNTVRGIIFKSKDGEAVDGSGQVLSGAKLDEAESIVKYMNRHLVNVLEIQYEKTGELSRQNR